MKNVFLVALLLSLFAVNTAVCDESFEEDIIPTSRGDLKITFIGHASFILTFGGTVIHVDPWSKMADYTKLPKADIVLVSHMHEDHLDPSVLDIICTDDTVLLYPEPCSRKYEGGIIMNYGDVKTVKGFRIETVPAYNLTNLMGTGGKVSHPKGLGNGYIVTFGDTRVYAAGETENIPELGEITDIDIAFFAMDSLYNMTPEMAADAARTIMPKILYPIHLIEEDPSKLEKLLSDTEIDVRIRAME